MEAETEQWARAKGGKALGLPYLVLGTEVLQDFLAGGAPDLYPGGLGRLRSGFLVLLSALAPALVPLQPWPAPRAAAAALAAPGSLGASLSHAQGIEIQGLALEGSLHVAEHAAVLLPWDLICGARPGQVHRQIVLVGAVPTPSARSHGSNDSGSRGLSSLEAKESSGRQRAHSHSDGVGGGA